MRSYANVKLLKIVIMLVLNRSNSIASYYFSMFVFIFTELSNCLVTWLHKKRIMKSTRGYNVDFVMHFVKLHTIYTIYYILIVNWQDSRLSITPMLHDFNNISNRGETISDSFQFLY